MEQQSSAKEQHSMQSRAIPHVPLEVVAAAYTREKP
jgi:hypothetical protein